MSGAADPVTRYELVGGGRGSQLARWQSALVAGRLETKWPHLSCKLREYSTHGDRAAERPLSEIGGRGVFTEAIEAALLSGEIDFAVHSLKDLPVRSPAGLNVAAVVGPRNAGEALVSRRGEKLDELAAGAVVGTSSLRRRAQLLAIRPDLRVSEIRGNVETRIAKVERGDYDATVLAAAGIERLSLQGVIAEYLDPDVILPAPGQGAIAVQCRADDPRTIELLRAIDDGLVNACTRAERSFLDALGAGCSAPVAALALPEGGRPEADSGGRRAIAYRMVGRVIAPDGSRTVEVDGTGDDPVKLGRELAREALEQGAAGILRGVAMRRETTRPQRALAGKRVVVTRPEGQAGEIVELLGAAGAEVFHIPTIRVLAISDSSATGEAFESLDAFDWILFASRNAFEYFQEAACRHRVALGALSARIAAVGAATAAALSAAGLDPDFVAAGSRGADLGRELSDVEGRSILLPCAERHSAELPRVLRERGAFLTLLPIYRTEPSQIDGPSIERLRRGVDWILFTSGSTVSGFVGGVRESAGEELLAAIIERSRIACIGRSTEAVLRRAGYVPAVVAEEHTGAGLVSAILKQETEKDR